MEDIKVSEVDFTKCNYLNDVIEVCCLSKALQYLSPDLQRWVCDNVAYFSTLGKIYGRRLSPGMCETKEIVYLSEKIFPVQFNKDDISTKFFIFVVLHETAHAKLKHKCKQDDNILDYKNDAQEQEADALALKWYNSHAMAECMAVLTQNEIDVYKLTFNNIVDEWNYLWNKHLQNSN